VVEVERDPDLAGARLAQHRYGQSVAEEQVVGGGEGRCPLAGARGVLPARVSREGAAPRLVEGDPPGHPVGQCLGDQSRVVGEPVGGVAVAPAAALLQGLRQVPVVERHGGFDAGVEEAVDQALVEVESRRVGRAGAGGLHPGPADGEPVGAHAEFLQQGDVLAVAVVVVARHVTGVAPEDRSGAPCERVPDGGAPAVLVDRALDLEGGGGRPEDEAGREGRKVTHSQRSSAPKPVLYSSRALWPLTYSFI